jgi:bacillithiol biosynthesis cysteine-adding enzyme BshC
MTSPVQTAVRRAPFADLGAFPALFVDYCTRFDAVADFYAGHWKDVSARREAAEAAARRPADRDALADVLLDQNERWGLDATTRSHIEALRDPESIAIVTGQQVGLFTGPLYTIYKTITTLQLAEEWAEQTGRTVVPVFWVEGEDHDFAEIATAHVLHRNEVVPLHYDPDAGDNPGAVGRLALTDAIDDVLDRLDEALPPSDFKPGVMERVRAAYPPGTRIEDAFTRLMRSLFEDEGLVFINPDDARLKALSRPLFRHELEDPETPAARIDAISQALRDRGYHAQVTARPTNLFWLGDDHRRAIDLGDDGTFHLRGTDRTFSRTELLDRLDTEPERFSPNVVLRPLMQDHLLPTAAYVAGPGEVSYFAQYGDVYEWAGLDRPLIHPRASVSLVEGKVQKVLDKYDLSVADFSDTLETLFQDVVVDTMEVDVDAVFSEAMPQLHQTINALKPEVEAVDRTLGSSAEATRAAIVDEMEALKQKVVRAEKRQQDEVRAQLEKAHVNLRPNGHLQERTITVLYYLNKYSPGLLDELCHALRTDTAAHQVVEL